MTDLVKRLRGDDHTCAENTGCGTMKFCACDTMEDAADLIEQQAARIAKLEGALRDISAECGECGGYGTYPAEETVTGKVLWWDCSNPVCKAGDSSGSEAARKQHVLRCPARVHQPHGWLHARRARAGLGQAPRWAASGRVASGD